jgi:DNA ligase-3
MIHKNGGKFDYFSRSKKEMKADKVHAVKDSLEKAIPGVTSIILDAEILMIDKKTNRGGRVWHLAVE